MTEKEYQSLVLLECGLLEDSKAMSSVSSWWAMYSDQADWFVRYLYTKKHAIIYKIGQCVTKVDVQIGADAIKNSQQVSNLKNLLAVVNEQIKFHDPSAGVPEMEVLVPSTNLPSAFLEQYSQEYLSGLSYLQGNYQVFPEVEADVTG